MRIEVFSDLICPWCYIGRHRLHMALAMRPHLTVSLHWLPFQLNPEIPSGGMEHESYLAAKFGSRERARQVYRLIEQTADADGLPLNLGSIAKVPNTIDAHRLVRHAARSDRAEPVIDKVFSAYFEEGHDIGDQEILLAIGEEAGLNRDELIDFLNSTRDILPVRTADISARRMGIHAVPCFILDEQFAIAGAQEPETFLPIFDVANAAAVENYSSAITA